VLLSVIIVNYNVRYFLEQALRSVRQAAQGLDVEVFVVDNKSSDDSVDMVQQLFPEVKLIANQQNVGFSTANNQAIKLAQGKYVLLLNPDTLVAEDTFQRICAFMDEHEEAGALGIKMIDGTGAYLPESKRGFPSPMVAFYKTFGLSKFFPKSKRFNFYHLGHLDKDENHEIEVLSGAFMLLRKTTLDKIGLLDEAFFMYGEDIDLSYRVIQAGYKNYYLADTSIIHYKGESTKKGSLNYVKTFYQAMVIFAKKHFSGAGGSLFVLMLQAAIWFRAIITLLQNAWQRFSMPILEATVLWLGLFFSKEAWEIVRYSEPDYFKPHLLYFNFPLYIGLWITAIYFSGGYDKPSTNRQVLQGIFTGTVAIAAIYGFLDAEYRASRMLIVLGAMWAVFALLLLRSLIHVWKHGHLRQDIQQRINLVVVGEQAEAERTLKLLQKAQVLTNYIGRVSTQQTEDQLGNMADLPAIIQMYDVNEVIFCSKTIPAKSIIHWMETLGPGVSYKIIPEGSDSIIGSNSKNSAGDLYTVELRYNISTPASKRNKLVFDYISSLLLLLSAPIWLLLSAKRMVILKAIFPVLLRQKTWVGYTQGHSKGLPKLLPGVFNPLDALTLYTSDEASLRRLNLFYARDYSSARDMEILVKSVLGG
jgi:GT2 family glycosyltransferase/uncharacterized membrane protein